MIQKELYKGFYIEFKSNKKTFIENYNIYIGFGKKENHLNFKEIYDYKTGVSFGEFKSLKEFKEYIKRISLKDIKRYLKTNSNEKINKKEYYNDIYIKALKTFEKQINNTKNIKSFINGYGIDASIWANGFIKPSDNQELYNKIYNIYFSYFENLKASA